MEYKQILLWVNTCSKSSLKTLKGVQKCRTSVLKFEKVYIYIQWAVVILVVNLFSSLSLKQIFSGTYSFPYLVCRLARFPKKNREKLRQISCEHFIYGIFYYICCQYDETKAFFLKLSFSWFLEDSRKILQSLRMRGFFCIRIKPL